MRSAAWFAVPSANVRLTRYNLDRTAASAPDTPSRAIPTFSFDSGAVFERDWAGGERAFLQTLEPRLFYLYVPYENQDDLPVFDTGEFDFSFLQLFRENRFSGPDRVGDANQLSLAVTSRLLASGSGEELARFNLGQIRYFRDREVTLPGEPVQTSSGSPIVAELNALIARRWTFAGGIQVNPSGWVNEKSSAALRYQPGPRRVVNLAYRFDRRNFEQTDISLAWPLATNWRLVARWNYALDAETTLEGFGGVEYESCCWALRTVLRRYVSGVGAQQTDSIFLQLEFKGLTGVGRSTVDFLERSIPGYENEF
jgi:LPS-assembly protein